MKKEDDRGKSTQSLPNLGTMIGRQDIVEIVREELAKSSGVKSGNCNCCLESISQVVRREIESTFELWRTMHKKVTEDVEQIVRNWRKREEGDQGTSTISSNKRTGSVRTADTGREKRVEPERVDGQSPGEDTEKPKRVVYSNKLAQRHMYEFESYADYMEMTGVAKHRKVQFVAENREMNIPANVLVGEQEIPVTFLLDTGAQRSFLSERVYNRKLKDKVKLRQSYVRMYGVSGKELTTIGEVEIDVQLGDDIIRQKFIVAELKEEGILGFDFCRSHQAEWRWTDKQLTLKPQVQVRHTEEETQVGRVVTSERIRVPARCEIMVRGIVEHAQKTAREGMIEPQETFVQKYPIGVAAVLAKREENSLPVRLINTQESDVELPKNTPVAWFREAEEVPTQKWRQVKEQGSTWDVRQQYEEQLSQLSYEEKEAFYALLQKYDAQFMTTKDVIGRTSLVQHKINTGDHAPIKQQPRREPLGLQGTVKEEIKKMEEKGVIEASQSPWASPIVLVKKKDGSIRFCVDYRKLNAVTQKDAYPLPRIDDNLEALKGAQWFSTLDLASGYWQVEMSPADKEKTAFCTKYGLYHFNVMPFGLCNAPGTFERLMETVLKGMQWERAVLYLDDIIIFSKDIQEHMERLEEIFQRLKAANLTLKPAKCHFFQQEVEFLGHIVSKEGVRTDPKKIEAIRTWTIPRRIRDVRAFLGLTGYYRRFIAGYGKLAKPLHELTEKGIPFVWTQAREEAFQKLKTALTQAPILGYPSQDPEDRFVLDTDASNCHIGGVLSQMQEGEERVIAYGSKVLSKAERNYCVTRRELLAVVQFTMQFKHYLLGRKFTVRTDHGALSWLFQFKHPEGQLARWLELLSQFDMDIVHRPGRVHSNGDGLSRRPCPDTCPTCKKGEIRWEKLSEEDGVREKEAVDTEMKDVRIIQTRKKTWEQQLLQAQKEDKHLRVISKWKQRPLWKDIAEEHEEVKVYWSRFPQLRRYEGCWQYKWRRDGRDTWKWIIPKSMRKELLEEHHNHKLGGHFSPAKTLDALHRSPYYWPYLSISVDHHIRDCDVCQRSKPAVKTLKAPMGTVQVTQPMERVAIDILGPLPETDRGNKYIIVISDYFTRWVEAYPVPNHQAKTVAQKVTEEFFLRFGLPTTIHTDQGRDFESQLFKELCRLLEVEKTRTTPWNPKSDGLIERYNRTLETLLRQTIEENQKDWDLMTPYCCSAYRTANHSTIKQTPNVMMLGRQLPLPSHLASAIPEEKKEGRIPFIQELEDKFHRSHELARRNQKQSTQRYKRQYDKGQYLQPIQPGKWVWLQNPTKKVGRSPKLQMQWEKYPYKVTELLSELVVEIKQFGGRKKRIVHRDRLKLVGDQQRWQRSEDEQQSSGAKDEAVTSSPGVLTTNALGQPCFMPRDNARNARGVARTRVA